MWRNFPLFPDTASDLAREVDALYFFALGVTAFFSLLIAGLIFYLGLRYRRRSPDEVGRPERPAMALEIVWSLVPLVITMFLFVWGARVFFSLSRPPADATEYYVVGKQWMWKFQHPEGVREINTLHVPVGRRIKLTMTSEDVLHSLYLPAMRTKADVLPGRYTTLWFQADKPGVFPLYCAEYCGAEHSRMIGRLVVLEPKDYEEWLAQGGRAVSTVLVSGEQLFQERSCATCHRPDAATRAPLLHGLFGKRVELASGGSAVADETYIRESILNPRAKLVAGYDPVMPAYQGQLSEDELVQLVIYVKSLGAAAPAGSTSP